LKLFKGGTIVKSTFEAHPLLKNSHLQTLWPTLLRASPKIKTIRERLLTLDQDFIDIDWYEKESLPLVILIHGLASSSKAKYIMGLQSALAGKGFASVALNLRGCSGEPNIRVTGYHGGSSEDLNFLVATLRYRFPNRPIAAIGYSLGASILLNWLSESAGQSELFAAITVSAPLQLDKATARLQQGFSKIYEQYLLTFMKWQQYKKNIKLYKKFEQHEKLPSLWNINTIFDFDEFITAPIHGYKGAEHYYNVCSTRQKLKLIQTPTLIIHAKDDPFIPPEIIPDEMELSNSVMMELAENGGHVGFISKNKNNQLSYWIETRAPYFLNQILTNKD